MNSLEYMINALPILTKSITYRYVQPTSQKMGSRHHRHHPDPFLGRNGPSSGQHLSPTQSNCSKAPSTRPCLLYLATQMSQPPTLGYVPVWLRNGGKNDPTTVWPKSVTKRHRHHDVHPPLPAHHLTCPTVSVLYR